MADKNCIEIVNAFEGLVQDYRGDEGLSAYRQMTKDQKLALADELFEEVSDDVRRAKLGAAAWYNIEQYLDKQGKNPKVFADMMSGAGVRGSGFLSLERRAEAVLHQFQSKLFEGLEKYRPRRFGLLHSKEAQRNIIRELKLPGSSGDKDAAQFAKTYQEANEYLRKAFNNAGGGIKQLEDFALPQYHDAVRIGRVSKQEWVSFVKDNIDTNRLVYKRTEEGLVGADLSEEVIDKMLGRVYENLASGGILHRDAAVNPHIRRMIGRHHQEHRILHFKDAESWMRYADRFGASDYVQSLNAHAEMLSREIAAMQIFGPNADLLVRKARLEVQKAVGRKDAGILGEQIYDQIMGKNYTNSTKLADVMRGVRNLSVGIKIGKAAISAISDLQFFGQTRVFNGLPVLQGYMDVLKGLVSSKSGRQTAAHLMLGARYAIDSAKSAYRISEVMGVGGTARFADFVVRASGLNYWTNVVRQQFGLGFLHTLGDNIERAYANLNPRLRGALSRYGITSAEWDIMRSAPLYEKEGARYLNPGAMPDDELAYKIVGMVMEETDFAVPEPNAKTMTILRGGSQPGTLSGELTRGVAMFKSFATSVILSHWMRALQLTPAKRMAYFASLITGTTLLGGLAIQAKYLVDGKTPANMDEKFWAAAFLQGGGTGILGDFLFQDHTRIGSVAEFIGGPLMADTSIALGLVFGSASDFAFARDKLHERAGRRAGRALDKLMPNLWQTNIIARRYFTDQLQMLANPKWASDQRAIRRRMNRERGQKYYWKPGSLTPQ